MGGVDKAEKQRGPRTVKVFPPSVQLEDYLVATAWVADADLLVPRGRKVCSLKRHTSVLLRGTFFRGEREGPGEIHLRRVFSELER